VVRVTNVLKGPTMLVETSVITVAEKDLNTIITSSLGSPLFVGNVGSRAVYTAH